MDVNTPETGKLRHRLSERRGLGSLTLNQDGVSKLESTANFCTGKLTRFAGAGIDDGARNYLPLVSKRKKVSHFRSMQQQDGAETDVVTVEELSRDCPPAGLSPASSPSSKYRALPGCSPRWPHTYHHGTIFSFPSLPSSSVSSSTYYQRRRLFYPVGLLACNCNTASRRLSTVVEKPVGDASIQLAYPIQNCALLVSDNTVLNRSPFDLKPLPDSEYKDGSSESLGSPCSLGLSQIVPTATLNANPFTPSLLTQFSSPPNSDISLTILQQSVSSDDEAQQHLSWQQQTAAASLYRCTKHSSFGVVDLPSHGHYQQAAYTVDNNRTTGDFCTNRARVVSLNPSCGGTQIEKSRSLTRSDHKRNEISDAVVVNREPHSEDSPRLPRALQEPNVLSDCANVVWRPLPYVDISTQTSMDRKSATPMTSLSYTALTSSSHDSSATCAPVDGTEVAASQSPSVTPSALTYKAQHHVNSQDQEMVCETCCSESCQEQDALCSDFARLHGSICASTTMAKATPFADQKPRLFTRNASSRASSQSLPEPNKKTKKDTLYVTLTEPLNEKVADNISFPHRPARSRSPNTSSSNCYSEAVRDRRAYSADRPICSPYPNSAIDIMEKVDESGPSRAVTYPKTNIGSTKVEKLRQLTRRLRPSSSTTHITGKGRSPEPPQFASAEESIRPPLPPIPIAPPRQPRLRSERKKSSRSKKDSATSTSDLVLPARSNPPTQNPIEADFSYIKNENFLGNGDTTGGSIVPDATPLSEGSLSAELPVLPTNEIRHQPHENLFADDSGKSNSNHPIPSNEDFFDEVHLTLSRLNPRIMVGTYQQRTIPFRSASFSQIDVGADGTYNRRPRTSITLKPVTYSIGKDVASNSSLPYSGSLPRRLKINERNCGETSNISKFHVAEDKKDMSTVPIAISNTSDSETIKDTTCQSSSYHTLVHRDCLTEDDRTHFCRKLMDDSTKELEELTDLNPEEFESMTKNQKSCSDALLNSEAFAKPPSFNDSEQNTEAGSTSKGCGVLQCVGHTTCLPEVANEVKEEAAEALDLTSYETTEVSVSAEIRLSPLPNVDSETNVLDVSETLTDAEALTNAKPLPVLDLLELNNHLLRLRAATRDSTLDRLADLEVAAQFGEAIPVISPSMDSSGASSRNSVVRTSDHSESRPWLNELVRLATNFERGENGWNPSDDSCPVHHLTRESSTIVDPVVKSDETCQAFDELSTSNSCAQPNLHVDILTTSLANTDNPSNDVTNKRSTVARKGPKRRRRHSSTVNDNCAGNNRRFHPKSDRGRSLTFPPASCWSNQMYLMYGDENNLLRIRGASGLSSPDDADATSTDNVEKGKTTHFTEHDEGSQRAESDPNVVNPIFNDATNRFQPIHTATEKCTSYPTPKYSLVEISLSNRSQALEIPDKPDVEIPPCASCLIVGSSLNDNDVATDTFISEIPQCQLLVKEGHYASVESDELEDSAGEDVLKQASPNEAEDLQVAKIDEKLCEEHEATSIHDSETNAPAKANHRLMVSLSVTLAPELSSTNPETHPMSLSPYCSDLETSAFNLSAEKVQRSPQNPRRYGLKRRPLRGPYGEMLEAEMNKSEFSKMYAKRNEDLSFLRELSPRVNRDAKSSSPRPLSPPASCGTHNLTSEPVSSNWSNVTASVRQNSASPSTAHSLDDSQLKIGYNATSLPIDISDRSSRHQRLTVPKRKSSANAPYDLLDSDSEVSNHMTGGNLLPAMSSPPLGCLENRHALPTGIESGAHIKAIPLPSHQRTLSSPCQLVLHEGGFTSEDEPDLLELTSLSSLSRSTAQLLNSESSNTDNLPVTRLGSAKRSRDTRTHAIGELYDTERSYVESLQILVTKYLQPLKGPECSGLVETNLVDEIFYQIPAILAHHEVFLEELRKRLESWDIKQCVGGVFLDTLTKPSVIETYTAYINHWKHANEAIKTACLAKSAFSKFLEATAREHKGKLALDSLLIMPVQRIPRYELLIKMLLKHTPREHPDHALLLDAQREVHELAVKINCVEREAYGAEQQQATLRELESLVEGLGPGNLATPERAFIRHDCVTIPSALGTRKERGFFLFSDLLVITSVKRRSAAIRKSSSYSTSGIASTLEANKFKLLMRVPLDDLEVTKNKEEGSKRSTKDLEHVEEDLAILNQITELVTLLHVSHSTLDEVIKEIQQGIQRQLNDKQNISTDSQLATLALSICTRDGIETLSVAFATSEKRASWEESFTETKLKLRAMSPERRPPPEFLMPLPIRKTRAGLQFTCAAPTVTWNTQHLNDVWVCNSDGYVGQVCILSLHPEPNVTSCNGVCNARITCIAAIPAAPSTTEESASNLGRSMFKNDSKFESSTFGASNPNEIKSSVCNKFELESESSSESSGSEDSADEDPANYNRYRSDSIPIEVNVLPASEEADTTNQATMWLGTEDGCIHIYHCGENIRLKKNRTRIQQGAAVLCLVYMDNCVFASLANGDVLIYQRSPSGVWNINEPKCVAVGSIIGPVTRMLPVGSGLWCTSQNTVKILNTSTLSIDDDFAVSSDSQRNVLSLACNGLGVWVAMQGSAVVRLFHALTHECISDVNLAPAVNKMLSGCDDIIRQHKAACLRVTSMMLFRDLLWVGTSAGVILTIPTPHLTPTSSRLSSPPFVTGLSHGHTGHVRFLTCVESIRDSHLLRSSRLHHNAHHGLSLKNKDSLASVMSSAANVSSHGTRLLVISGGDGYEDFRHSGLSDSVGREDSTNHLLLWQV
ncbi:LOW QUALITY PROTEIN: uncharacterized protein LOC116921335 [Daphnia magna]|uniref:LOW QUALITY PROTEIN: uncharacterized protein LOC116921335 n=1 Tax=Daphnia magna TaxID=35525 RepID=UPI001E1BB60E|nr:LOW QUALITY PROTEIN: uncharacterized protein LOC116921335 [Daphnia magna]